VWHFFLSSHSAQVSRTDSASNIQYAVVISPTSFFADLPPYTAFLWKSLSICSCQGTPNTFPSRVFLRWFSLKPTKREWNKELFGLAIGSDFRLKTVGEQYRFTPVKAGEVYYMAPCTAWVPPLDLSDLSQICTSSSIHPSNTTLNLNSP
jgi:hypothetical protein